MELGPRTLGGGKEREGVGEAMLGSNIIKRVELVRTTGGEPNILSCGCLSEPSNFIQ